MFRTRCAAALISLVLALAGCATLSASKAPDAHLDTLKTFYVVRQPKDSKGIEKLFADRLTTMGRKATFGDAPGLPEPVDAVVTYQDKWMWDINMYLIQLDVQIRDGKTGEILASGTSMRPSLERKSPEAMVEETLKEIFK